MLIKKNTGSLTAWRYRRCVKYSEDITMGSASGSGDTNLQDRSVWDQRDQRDSEQHRPLLHNHPWMFPPGEKASYSAECSRQTAERAKCKNCEQIRIKAHATSRWIKVRLPLLGLWTWPLKAACLGIINKNIIKNVLH